jgi:membrane protein DedA with SNARE-associated domain
VAVLFWNAAGGIVWATAVGLTAYYAGQTAGNAIQRYGPYAGAALTVGVIVGWLGVRWVRQRVETRL